MRKLLLLGILFVCYFKMAVASDTLNIDGLDNMASTGIQIIKFLAKWGGLAAFVIGGLMIGFHKAKGETLGILAWCLLAGGLIIAAFSWWPAQFTAGFAW